MHMGAALIVYYAREGHSRRGLWYGIIVVIRNQYNIIVHNVMCCTYSERAQEKTPNPGPNFGRFLIPIVEYT